MKMRHLLLLFIALLLALTIQTTPQASADEHAGDYGDYWY